MKSPKMYSITGLRRCKVIIVARMYQLSSLASCGFGKRKPEAKGSGFTFEVEGFYETRKPLHQKGARVGVTLGW